MARPNWNLLRVLLARAGREPYAVADFELLDRYRATKDGAAFELLVRRYADLVFGVCRRVCRDEQDAEDAFQATFLVLARKAGRVRQNLAGWLHRTANRAALRAASRRTRIQIRETALTIEPAAPTAKELSELRAVLDAEIDRLPERLRLAVLHCYVEGRSTEDAAERLSVPRGTILSRLSKARDLLAERLARRGVTAPVTVISLTAALSGETATASLVATATSSVLTPVADSAAYLISLEVLRMTAWKTTTAWAAAIVLTAGIGTGTGIIMAQGEKPGAIPTAAAQTPAQTLTRAAPPEAVVPSATAGSQHPREVRIKELELQLEQRMDKQEKLRRDLHQMKVSYRNEKISQVDSKVLADALARLDLEYIALEEQEAEADANLSEAKQALEKAQKIPLSEEDVLKIIVRKMDVNQLQVSCRRIQDQIRTLEQATKEPNNPMLQKAREELKIAEKDLKEAIERHRPVVENGLRKNSVLTNEAQVSKLTDDLKKLQTKMAIKKAHRANLVERIRKQPLDEDASQRLEKEIDSNQHSIDDLQRHLNNLKWGTAGESSNATIERLMQEVIELRAEVQKLKEGKK